MTKPPVHIESNGYGGASSDGELNTRITLDGVDISHYVADITWTIGISGPRDGRDPAARADIRYNAVRLDADAGLDPHRRKGVQAVREWVDRTGPAPALVHCEDVLAELDMARARAAALTYRRWPVDRAPDPRDAELAQLRDRVEALQHVAAQMLNAFDTKTRPGYDAMRSRHVEMRQIQTWREVVWPSAPAAVQPDRAATAEQPAELQ